MNKAVLRLERVSITAGSEPILRVIDATVMPGDAVRILGDNGSGKSTLLSSIAGIVPIASGSILGLHGMRIVSPRTARLQGVRYAMQTPCFAESWTVLDYLSLLLPTQAIEDVSDRLAAWMPMVRLKSLIDELSFGDRKWLACFGIMAQGADLTLLDEPLSGQGHERGLILSKAIEQGTTVGRAFFLVEHSSVESILSVNRRLRIEEGRLHES